MNSNLVFDFQVDKENKAVYIKREFAAELQLVWRAWTEPELLDQWWAPKPWEARTQSMDFRDGGVWLYVMAGPNNEEHWCRVDYISIEKEKSITGYDAFCDPQGVINEEMPRTKWMNRFISQPDSTLVDIKLTFDSLPDLEKLIEMGFREGFTMGLANLDELLLQLKKQG